MFGPEPMGHWSSVKGRNCGTKYRSLVAGEVYRVEQAFVDYDGELHEAGEQWTFLGYSFLPYDDGLSLFVSLDGSREWHIRMQLRPDEQQPVVDALEQYVTRVAPQ